MDRALEAAILELLDHRAAGATICPSEAARRVASQPSAGSHARVGTPARTSARSGTAAEPSATEEPWRVLLEPARRAARRLVASGEVELTQRGRVVDPSAFRGPVRIRRSAAR